MSLTNCRFYENRYPDIDEFVMVNVRWSFFRFPRSTRGLLISCTGQTGKPPVSQEYRKTMTHDRTDRRNGRLRQTT